MCVRVYEARDDDFVFAIYNACSFWEMKYGVVLPDGGDAVGEDVDVAVSNDLARCIEGQDCGGMEEDGVAVCHDGRMYEPAHELGVKKIDQFIFLLLFLCFLPFEFHHVKDVNKKR